MRSLAAIIGLMILIAGAVSCTVQVGRATESPTLPTGELTILGSPAENYILGMARAFELDSGIKTTYVRKSSGEALDSIRETYGSPPFSVWWGGPIDGYIAAAAEGLLEPYRPHGSSVIPSKYKDENGAWTGVYVGVLGLAVNKRVLVANGLPEPNSWADLAKPIYKGQISMAHPASSGTAYTALATILQLHNKDVDKGFEYLRALNENISKYEVMGAAPATLAGGGKVAIGIAFSHDIVAAIDAGYTDLEVVFPAEGTGYEIGGMALIRDAPNPGPARQFMDWALSAKAQELGPLFSAYQIPTNPDAKVPLKSVRLSSVKLVDYDFIWAGDRRQAFVNRFSATIALPPT